MTDITHLGRACDALAADMHKAISLASIVSRDLHAGTVAVDDAALLVKMASQLMGRADHVSDLLMAVAGDVAERLPVPDDDPLEPEGSA